MEILFMLVDTQNLVTKDQLRNELDRYIDAAANGNGPVALTENSRVIGFLVSPEEYEALHGGAVTRLLKSRMSGETVSHESIRKKTAETLRRKRRTS